MPSAFRAEAPTRDTIIVVIEGASGCDGPPMTALAARGIAFARVDPRQARGVARAIGLAPEIEQAPGRVLAGTGTSSVCRSPRPPARPAPA